MSNEKLLQNLLIFSLIVALTFGFFGNASAFTRFSWTRSAGDTQMLALEHRPPDITPPVANAGPDQFVDEDVKVQFDGSGSTDNIGIRSYVWTFVDGTPRTLNGIAPAYTFLNPGICTVTLKVSDAARNWDTDTMIVTVRDITAPVTNAGPDQSVDEDSLVTFDGTFSTDNVGITSYVWTFVDGTTKTLNGSVPTYTFSNPGNYSVTLNVTDAAGDWATDTVTITVRDITPPTITAVTQSPSGNVDEGQLVKVSANITDVGSGVKNATLIYSNDNGTSWQTPLQMRYNSTTGLYETTILGHISGTWVKYKITAYDNAGNLMTENNAGQYYTYQVIPEFSATYVILLFILTTTLTATIYRKTRTCKNMKNTR